MSEVSGWFRRASAPVGGWVLQSELSENPYMKDRVEAQKEQNMCAVFVYVPADPANKGRVHLPDMRAYTKEQLLAPDALRTMVGINENLVKQALAMYSGKNNVVKFPSDTSRVQMAASLSNTGPAAQLS